ncbi:glycosyl transferase family 1 [Pragia fontium]|uniref:Glycosyl transferase family 1 n=1 Tax=Pragia fontium TaxID=82985 RepID=A0ABQ5LKV0_9GAMM|nr:glycosyltransferase family 4 protein [Pragia fontium]GKX64247.1 glycosyl transferase family 1 [Pragia fontium]
MNPIRLAIVRQKYRPDGGAERFISRALEALKGHNLSLNVITREWQGEQDPDWHIFPCNPTKWGRISREKGFAHAARQIWQQEKFDLVQSHERIPGCDIYRAGDGVHRRWLLQRARILPVWRQKLLFNDRYHRYVMNAERDMYGAPELRAVICNAEMIKREIMEDFGVPESKINVIYNAIDSQRFMPGNEQIRQQIRAQLNIAHDVSCLIYVGSGFERKGLAAAIKALAPTSRHLMVIGKDKDEKRYKNLAMGLGCQNRVHFLGVQNNVLPYYQAADGLLLPTLYDPFPNVILEAMACGLPVITSHTCGGAEFIEQGISGFVCDALNTDALTVAINELPQQALGSSMGQVARERVKPQDATRLSQQLVTLYQRLMSI